MAPGRNPHFKAWILVVLPVLVIPFENELTIFGFSLAKVAIIPLLLWTLVFQTRLVLSMWKNSVLLCCLAFVFWGAFCEALHPYSDWELQYQLLQLIVFAGLVGSVSSNVLVFRRVLYAIALVSSILALYLVANFYGVVSMDVAGVREAGRVRSLVYDELSLASNLNSLAYTVTMGAIVALANLLGTNRARLRLLWGGVYLLCAVGSFVPLSRGAFLGLIGASVLVVWRSLRGRIRPGKVLLVVAMTAITFTLVPESLTKRYEGISETETRKPDGRTVIYTAAKDSLPEYWAIGVGEGQFWRRWGYRHGFGTVGPHNGFLASWIYFGLPGLLLLLLICFLAAHAAPKREVKSLEVVCLSGLLVLGLFWLLFTHNLYLKPFGLLLGLLIGASQIKASTGFDGHLRKRTSMSLRRSIPAHRGKTLPEIPALYGHRAGGAYSFRPR